MRIKKLVLATITVAMLLTSAPMGTIKAANTSDLYTYDSYELEEVTTASKKLQAPVIKKAEVTDDGIVISFKKVKGATRYQIVRYNSKTKKWNVIGYAKNEKGKATIKFVDKKAVAGKTYTYKVRCVKNNKKTALSKYSKSYKVTYMNAPELVSAIMNTETKAVRLEWKAVDKAVKYVVYRKEGNRWKKVGYSNTTAFTDTTAPFGKNITYTVQCVDVKNNLIGGYDKKGITTEKYVVKEEIRLEYPAREQPWYERGYKCQCRKLRTTDYNVLDKHQTERMSNGICGRWITCDVFVGYLHNPANYKTEVYYSDGTENVIHWEDPNDEKYLIPKEWWEDPKLDFDHDPLLDE